MRKNSIRCAFWTGLATLIVQQISSYIWGESGPPTTTPYIGLLFPVIWVFFLFFHLITLQLFSKGDHRSTIYYLGLLGAKMFLAMITVLLYGFFNQEGLRTFVSVFLPLYVVLTAIQVTETLYFVRKQGEDQSPSEE